MLSSQSESASSHSCLYMNIHEDYTSIMQIMQCIYSKLHIYEKKQASYFLACLNLHYF